MWKRNVQSESSIRAPASVLSGNVHGNDIVVGDHNSPARKVIIRQSCFSIPDRDFKFRVDDTMVSAVCVEDKGYLPDTVYGDVRPSDYWEKKTLHTSKLEVSVLSFSDTVFSIAASITFRATGGDVDATVFGDFRFKPGNPRNISAILQSGFAHTEVNGYVEMKYLTAEGLEKIIQTGLQDIVRRPLFRDRIYSDLESVSEAMKEQIERSAYFSERCLETTQLDVRPDRTEFEKLDDAEALHAVDIRKIELDSELAEKKKQIDRDSEMADIQYALCLEESKKRLAELELQISDCKRADRIKDLEAELQKIRLSLDADHYETDYQDGRKKRELDDAQRREIELLEAKTDNLIRMTNAAIGLNSASKVHADAQIKCPNCGTEVNRGSKFCPNCGSVLQSIKHSCKEIPQEILSMFDSIRLVFNEAENNADHEGQTIVMSPVVRNLPHNFKGTVAATDSITFESSKEYVLRFYYRDELLVSPHFYEEAGFRREVGQDGQELVFYSDYARYIVSNDLLGASKMQAVSRQPVLILCLDDRFYLCCMKDAGYLKIGGTDVGRGEITELELGKRVYLGSTMSFVVELA